MKDVTMVFIAAGVAAYVAPIIEAKFYPVAQDANGLTGNDPHMAGQSTSTAPTGNHDFVHIGMHGVITMLMFNILSMAVGGKPITVGVAA
jgi:hypothetical protein